MSEEKLLPWQPFRFSDLRSSQLELHFDGSMQKRRNSTGVTSLLYVAIDLSMSLLTERRIVVGSVTIMCPKFIFIGFQCALRIRVLLWQYFMLLGVFYPLICNWPIDCALSLNNLDEIYGCFCLLRDIDWRCYYQVPVVYICWLPMCLIGQCFLSVFDVFCIILCHNKHFMSG